MNIIADWVCKNMNIKDLSHDIKQFKQALKGFILSNSFYSLEEYFNFNW
jgi:hypothetical protein